MSVTTLHTAGPGLDDVERAVRADALLLLIRAKLLHQGAGEEAMGVLGITRDDMADARDRNPGAMVRGPVRHPVRDDEDQPARPVLADRSDAAWRETEPKRYVPPARPSSPPSRRQPTVVRPVGEDGKLRCSRCGLWKEPNEFRLRSDSIGSGRRRSACDPCHAADNKRRYVSLTTSAALRTVGLVLSLEPGDEAAKLRCTRCLQPLGTEVDVTPGNVRLSQVVCPA